MNAPKWLACPFLLAGLCTSLLATQPQAPLPDKAFGKKDKKGFGGFGPGSFGPGGPGGPFGQERKLVERFDQNGDGRLDNDERKAARAAIAKEPRGGFGLGGPKGPGAPRGPGAPMRFGPGALLTKSLLEALDADTDGALNLDEVNTGVKRLVEGAKAASGVLDEKRLGEALAVLLPRPPGPGDFRGPVPQAPQDGKKEGPRGFGFVGFNPAARLATSIIERADANKDDKATPAELTAAAALLFKDSDKNKDAKLDDGELSTAIGLLLPPPPGFGPGGPGGGPFGKGGRDPAKPGARVAPDQAKHYPDAPLYEPTVLRTLFLEFENKDWEAELADFKGSDVEVPATLIVDGKKYPEVGVHFRGMSSFGMVPAGYKRSLNLSLDFVDEKQRLYGYKTLNLLNASGDPSLLSTALYSHIANKFIPAPKANFVKVVINGENWGVYGNVQQVDKDFLAETLPGGKGTRWKVKGSPGGDGGLSYAGENLDEYKRRYQIKSGESAKAWKALVELCRTLDKTQLDQLEEKLAPMLDIDGALKFLALDVVLSNSDGYWIRASDYYLFRDAKGTFHIVPHDMNEAFQPGMGGFGPDPLVGLDDARKPLRSRLLAVPSLKARYLQYVRAVAEELDWNKLGPVVGQYRRLIDQEVATETRKLMTLAAFQTAVADAPADDGPGGRRAGLRAFADGRRNDILNHPAVKQASKEATR